MLRRIGHRSGLGARLAVGMGVAKVTANLQAAAHSFTSLSEAVGRNVTFPNGPDIDEAVSRQRHRAHSELCPARLEIASRHWDRHTIWIETSMYPIFDTNGDLLNIVSIDRDVSEAKERERLPANAGREFGGLRMRVAEDNRTNTLLIERILSGTGTVTAFPTTGREALELFENFVPAIILMDLHMPILNGLGATRHIPDRLPGPSRRPGCGALVERLPFSSGAGPGSLPGANGGKVG